MSRGECWNGPLCHSASCKAVSFINLSFGSIIAMKSMSKSMVACMNCRRRKVRCDGKEPCLTCIESDISTKCEYGQPQTTAVTYLKRGTACIPCRDKKKKCDGLKPSCSTCQVAKQAGSCQYESFGNQTPSKVSDILAIEISNCRKLREVSPREELPSLSYENFNADWPIDLTAPLQCQPWNPGQHVVPCFMTFGAYESNSTQHVAMPASHLTPQYFESFFNHGIQLGLTLSPSAINTIQQGDLSGRAIHPGLVHIAQLWGCILWQKPNSMRVTHESIHLKSALDSLTRTARRPSPLESLQAHILLTAYACYKGDMKSCRDFMHLASDDIQSNRMHIFDKSALAPTQIEADSQAVCWFLSYASSPFNKCFDNPALTRRLNLEFDELMVTYPDMALNNLCILRVAAVVALKKSNDHVARWDRAGGSSGDSLPIDSTTGVINMSSPLLIEHWDLVGQIHKISAAVNTAMLLASFSPTQRTTELALKVSCVTLLAAAAMSHRLLALWHPESARKCVLSATEVVSVSTSFSGDDYAYLDPTLMVCWNEAADILQQRLQGSTSTLECSSLDNKLTILQECRVNLKSALPFL